MKEYRLVDFGDFRKLELFGTILVDRPCPQAEGKKNSRAPWDRAHARFERDSGWETLREMPERWSLDCGSFMLELSLLSGGQLGVFPDHEDSWLFMTEAIAGVQRKVSLLNGFAYTGAATLAASALNTGEKQVMVCHVDASRSAVERARRNALLSGLEENPVRWIVDDMLQFMRREVKRGHRYDAIALDPPAFGRSKSGGIWEFDRSFAELMELTKALLNDNPLFVTISAHEAGLWAETLSRNIPPLGEKKRVKKTIALSCESGKQLNVGCVARLLF